MRYIASIILIIVVLGGCGSSSDKEGGTLKNAPQPNIEKSELQPPKPPSL